MKLKFTTVVEEFGQGDFEEYRIPAVTVTERGTVVTAFESRREAHNDWAGVWITVRVSRDGGRTFGAPVYPHMLLGRTDGEGNTTWSNPVLIPDRERLHLIFHENYEKAWYCFSQDDGASFSRPVEITAAYRALPWTWNVCASGPGHGIVSSDRRLVVPIWLAQGQIRYDLEKSGRIKNHFPSVAGCVYSDDRGNSWCPGFVTQGIENANETTLVQRDDGKYLFNFRNERFEKCRVLGTADQSLSGLEQVRSAAELPDPTCFGSMIKTKQGLYFVNCANADIRRFYAPRINLTVYRGNSEGTEWIPVLLVDEKGGYADIGADEEGLFILYERGDAGKVKQMLLKKFVW